MQDSNQSKEITHQQSPGKSDLGSLRLRETWQLSITNSLTEACHILYPPDYHDTKKAGMELNFTDKKKALAEHEKGVRGQEKEFDRKEFFCRSPAIFNMHR